ncbi:phage tail protein [Pseudomonas sp. AN-1]|uniref:phage tail protein n=1 Tax=Pseudomonas sp. AN-1 TaxID=3096605 RepID=UPI002A6A1899|nr:phage tail protein [Pseudomonas sp. AN-1]WPP47693.1 phage tail protein [Pseudomonas sp. AN-1]
MMMCLGQFVFSLSTLAYQDFQRQTQWRHPSNSRVGARPARQFAGPGDDTITLQGLLAPELTGSIESLDKLREMADTGSAWPLVEGTGRVYGLYAIEGLNEGRTLFFQDGAARRIEFTVNLVRVDDDRVDRMGTLA